MFSNTIVVQTILLTLLAVNVLPALIFTQVELGGNTEQQLVRLGEFEDKVYYTDSTLREWLDALKFCQSNGMELVALESQGELEYLSALVLNTYWTSGRQIVFSGLRDHYWQQTKVTSGFKINTSVTSYLPLSCVALAPSDRPNVEINSCLIARPSICEQKKN